MFLGRRDPRFLLAGVGADATSLRSIWVLSVALMGSLAGASLAAPATHAALEHWRAATGSGVAQWMLDLGFIRLFRSWRWLVILAMLPWIMRLCGMPGLRGLGFDSDRLLMRSGRRWIWVGLLLIALVAAAQLAFAHVTWRPRQASWVWDIGQCIVIGYVSGIGEALVFCGMVLRLFYTATLQPALAAALMATCFAFTHLKAPAQLLDDIAAVATWDTGLRLGLWTFLGMFLGFEPALFAGYWLLGMTLGALTLRCGSLWPAVGLVTGLVAGKLVLQKLWVHADGPQRLVWGGQQIVDGWVPVGVLLLLLVQVLATQKD